MAQLLCTRVNAAFTLTQQAPSTGSVATQRCGSCNAIGYIKSHSWLQLGSGRIGGRGVQLSFSVSLQTARGRNDAEIVWRCQVERKREGETVGVDIQQGSGGESGAKGFQKHTVTEWLFTAEMCDLSSQPLPKLKVVAVAIRAFQLNPAQCCLGTAQHTNSVIKQLTAP